MPRQEKMLSGRHGGGVVDVLFGVWREFERALSHVCRPLQARLPFGKNESVVIFRRCDNGVSMCT